MFVSCECCVLSGRGLCDGLITRPEDSYRLWRVVVCDQETSRMRRLKPATGLWKIQPQGCNTKKRNNKQVVAIITTCCNIKIVDILPQTVFVCFVQMLTINGHHFSYHNLQIGLRNGHGLYSLWGRRWSFIYNLDECLKVDENQETRLPGQKFPCFSFFFKQMLRQM